jgi:hypothetical protein
MKIGKIYFMIRNNRIEKVKLIKKIQSIDTILIDKQKDLEEVFNEQIFDSKITYIVLCRTLNNIYVFREVRFDEIHESAKDAANALLDDFETRKYD